MEIRYIIKQNLDFFLIFVWIFSMVFEAFGIFGVLCIINAYF